MQLVVWKVGLGLEAALEIVGQSGSFALPCFFCARDNAVIISITSRMTCLQHM